MSDDWEFSGADDAKAEIRAAVGYLLRGTTDGIRGDIVEAIISIVREVAGCYFGHAPRAATSHLSLVLGCRPHDA